MSNVRAILNPALNQLFASPSARYEAGRSRRDVVLLESHADLADDDERIDPLDTLLHKKKSQLIGSKPKREIRKPS